MEQNSNNLSEDKNASDNSSILEPLILLYVVWPAIAIPLALAISAYDSRQIRLSKLEDTTSLASVGMITNYYGQVINKTQFGEGIDGYVALDKSGDGKIDLIKEYGIKMVNGGRIGHYPKHYTERYLLGDKQFETLRGKYFSQCAHLPLPKKI